ncbi:unnamed protein product [Dovyalis caffra]|uniref:F-box domain-containing protein n=1 Tax=Dovyalis caffra TaxID=77055 RepID=A0AAV1RPX0_9ROSI|nr:unnamed protein product [Dovyalis caffra]
MGMAATTISADRISQLPDQIIHHILSFLATPEVVRLSVLSKPWYCVFTSFPISDFSGPSFERDSDDRKLQFAAFVYTSLLRQLRHYRSIPKFQLSLTRDFYSPYVCSPPPWLQLRLDKYINRSIRLATQKGVKELSIHIYCFPFYRLPETLLSAKELVVCRLYGCALNSTIDLPSLRELSLDSVEICDQMIIDNLTFTCPLIEKFVLIDCRRLDCLKLLGFRKLKKVKVKSQLFNSEGKRIEIDAVCLQTFSFSYSPYSSIMDESHFDLTSCKNLEVFKFRGGNITDSMIQYLHSTFPTLKVLVLDGFLGPRIEVSMPQLEKLYLAVRQVVAEDVVINTPRLQSFKYVLENFPALFSVNQTSLQEVTLELFLDDIYRCHREHFVEDFREYLKNFDKIKPLTLHVTEDSSGMHEIINNITNPVLLDNSHLKLKISLDGKDGHSIAKEGHALVDDLFCICRPESLFLESGCQTTEAFMEILCKKLVRGVKHRHHCSATDGKCWRHDLKGIKVERCGRNGYTNVLNCDALLDSLQTLEPEAKIRFVFEW